MLNRFKTEDEGFTLIELLVVILIIGILAAIALPSFLGQQKKAQDSSAKSNARNAVSQVESCYADAQSYSSCDTTILSGTGIPTSGDEAVTVTPSTDGKGYTIVAASKSTKTFTITKSSTDGTSSRTCSGTSCTW